MELRCIRGMKDWSPNLYRDYDFIYKTAEQIGIQYGFESIATPILEYTNVFARTLGDFSDVISKEMYTFTDKGGESIALRPEMTAGIMRSYLTDYVKHSKIPARFFSYGALFRYDRPQAGRLRQFHQINFEYIGGRHSPYDDAEMISLGYKIIKALKIDIENIKLNINSLASTENRKAYELALKEYFELYRSSLSQASKIRIESNVLRIFDSKDETDKAICMDAPLIGDFYNDTDRKYFERVLEFLVYLGIPYDINSRLVRGLDYYCHTVFEFINNDKQGAQNSILSGGRYDKLAQIMGNVEPISSFGFAGGVERLANLAATEVIKKQLIVIIPIYSNLEAEKNEKNELILQESIQILQQLREANLAAMIDNDGKTDKRIARASSRGADFVIFLGEDEIKSNLYKVKCLGTAQEHKISKNDITSQLRSFLQNDSIAI